MVDQSRLVIHLELIASGNHHYYGSLSAMYSNFTKADLGIAQQTLYNQWRKESYYQNDKIILRKGRLIQKKHSLLGTEE